MRSDTCTTRTRRTASTSGTPIRIIRRRARELAHFARTGFRGDREGIAIYALPDGTGYIVCTDQLEDDSEYHVYPREGAPGNPHDHSREIAVLRGGADATDGIEISSRRARTGPAERRR